MKLILKALLIVCSVSMLSIAHGQSYSLRVSDVRNTTYSTQGTIEECLLSVRPKGLFMEFGLYLSFSSRGSNFKSNDSLEVVLNFSLPDKAVITDSWLWIGNEICQASLLDAFSASKIYENIVKRRRDPSLLTKNSNNGFTLRVFPMGGNEQRHVKITYLVPVSWTETNVQVPVPVEIINTSRYIPLDFPIIFWNDENFLFEKASNTSASPLTERIDPILGPYKTMTFAPIGNFKSNTLSYSLKNAAAVYVGANKNSDVSYYQFAVRPNQLIADTQAIKVVFLVDYQENTSISKDDVLSNLKNFMKQSLTSNDSFNIVFSSFNVQPSAAQWVAAYDYNIDSVIDVTSLKLATYSNLPNVISKGIEFINQHGQTGNLILLNNSDQFNFYVSSNELLKEIAILNKNEYVISTVDFGSNSKWSYFNNRYYYANEYFLSNLANLYGGIYVNTRNGKSFMQALEQTKETFQNVIENIDIHFKPSQGIAYAKYTLDPVGTFVSTRDVIRQVGVFKGEFPLILEISGEYNNQIFSKSFLFDESNLVLLDSMGKKQWQALSILNLENQNGGTNHVDIIRKSQEYRILTTYTAFLCIEDTLFYCPTCIDEKNVPVDNDDQKLDSLWEIKVYPNPFIDVLNIEVHFQNEIATTGEVTGRILDLSGKTVHRFSALVNSSNVLQYQWDGSNLNGLQSAPGVYVVMLETKQGMVRQKVIKGN